MTERAFFGFRDHSAEIGSVGLFFPDIAAGGGNYDAVIASMSAVQVELEDITLCSDSGYGYRDQIGADSGIVPASNLAQRESGLRVFLRDDVTGKKSNFTVPGPDLAALTIPEGTDVVDLADASVMADLVTAIEANAKSEAGNAISVTQAVIVGRNN